jgi:hypothetical protein
MIVESWCDWVEADSMTCLTLDQANALMAAALADDAACVRAARRVPDLVGSRPESGD